jgi:hypothetical protein
MHSREPEIGRWLQIPASEYHSGPGYSRSFLWDVLNRTPAHAIWSRQHPTEPTEAMIFGSAYHTAALEPEVFRREYIVSEASRRTNAGRLIHASYGEAGLNVLKEETYVQILAMEAALRAHPIAGPLLALPGTSEATLFARHPIWNLLLKIRTDRLLQSGVILDLKTTACAAPRQFRSHAYELGYHMQAAMYPEVMRMAGVPVPEAPRFVFIAQEKDPPYFVAVYYADEEMERDGRADMERACEIVARCEDKQVWPAYPEEFMPIGIPGWKKRQQKENEYGY